MMNYSMTPTADDRTRFCEVIAHSEFHFGKSLAARRRCVIAITGEECD
jgi:hypothetical protein